MKALIVALSLVCLTAYANSNVKRAADRTLQLRADCEAHASEKNGWFDAYTHGSLVKGCLIEKRIAVLKQVIDQTYKIQGLSAGLGLNMQESNLNRVNALMGTVRELEATRGTFVGAISTSKQLMLLDGELREYFANADLIKDLRKIR